MNTFCFGKHPKKEDNRNLQMANYLDMSQITILPAWENLTTVYSKLGISDVSKLFPMDDNDKIGNCTIAAIAHGETSFNGLIGKKKIPSTRLVDHFYYGLTGGQDTGLAMLNVMNAWMKRPFDAEKMIAFAEVDPKNTDHVKATIQLFGGIYLGFKVQKNAIQDFNNKVSWTPGVLTDDGHAVWITGFDQNYLTVLTWGRDQKGTWSWELETADECYGILPPEAKKPGFHPGFNFDQLQADLALIKKK